MPWIVITGARPYDGRYELNLADGFTVSEMGWIRRLADYLPLEIEKGFFGGDQELWAALAVIALLRAGRIDKREVQATFDRLGDAPAGTGIVYEGDQADQDDEDDAGPPASSSSVNEPSSGAGSMTSSETSQVTPAGYGTPASDTSESTPIRLAT